MVLEEKELVTSVRRRMHISQKTPEQGCYIITRPLLRDILYVMRDSERRGRISIGCVDRIS